LEQTGTLQADRAAVGWCFRFHETARWWCALGILPETQPASWRAEKAVASYCTPHEGDLLTPYFQKQSRQVVEYKCECPESDKTKPLSY
jgi:hypothetical protein